MFQEKIRASLVLSYNITTGSFQWIADSNVSHTKKITCIFWYLENLFHFTSVEHMFDFSDEIPHEWKIIVLVQYFSIFR